MDLIYSNIHKRCDRPNSFSPHTVTYTIIWAGKNLKALSLMTILSGTDYERLLVVDAVESELEVSQNRSQWKGRRVEVI